MHPSRISYVFARMCVSLFNIKMVMYQTTNFLHLTIYFHYFPRISTYMCYITWMTIYDSFYIFTITYLTFLHYEIISVFCYCKQMMQWVSFYIHICTSVGISKSEISESKTYTFYLNNYILSNNSREWVSQHCYQVSVFSNSETSLCQVFILFSHFSLAFLFDVILFTERGPGIMRIWGLAQR